MTEYITKEEFERFKDSIREQLSGKSSGVKRSRVKRAPSAYNMFMKTEVPKVKKKNPSLSHIEAFTVAAQGWSKKK